MANEPIYDVASFDCKNRLCSNQTVVETRLLPMGGVSISKVLSYSAESVVSVTDVFTGEARVSGKVAFKVLFLDLEGGLKMVENALEFTDKISDDSITGTKPEIHSRILDIDIVSVTADEIKLAAIVEMDLFDNISSRVRFLQFGGEDIYTSDKKLEFSRLTTRIQENFLVSDEVSVEGEKLLLVEPRVILLSADSGMDNIALEGEIITNIVTQKGEEIFNYRIVTPFKEECAALDARIGSLAECDLTITSVKPSLSLEENGGTVMLEYQLYLNAFIYAEDSISPISDAFSINSDLSITLTDLKVMRNRQQKTVFERVEGSVTLENDMPIADKILASCGSKLSIANSYILEGRLVLEGTVTSAVLYYSGETGTKNSVDVELPFSITTTESMGENIIASYGEVTELTAKIRRGNQIDLKAEIAVTVSSAINENIKLITELSVGAPSPLPSSAISLHIARHGESLWDIAKSLRTTPELILLQNPDIELPLKGGERVAVYRHIKK